MWEVPLWLSLLDLLGGIPGTVNQPACSPTAATAVIGISALVTAALFSQGEKQKTEPDEQAFVPKRICRIVTRLDMGGVAPHCIQLAEGMEAYGWETHLIHGNINPDEEGSMEYLAEEHDIQTHRIPTMQRAPHVLNDLRSLLEIYRTLRRLRPQVVDTHQGKAGFIGRLAATLCGVPVIVHTFHGITLRDYFGAIKSTIYRLIERISAWYSTALICTGPGDRSDLIELGIAGPEKLVIIPYGRPLARLADLSDWRGQLREELGLSDDTSVVVFIGRLVAIKNVPCFLKMADRVRKRHDGVHFVIFGEGPQEEALQQQAAEPGLTETVTFYGFTREIEKAYADADLLVLCSDREGMPMVLMEALAAGVPVVSTDVGNVRNMVREGQTGRLVPPRDPDALADAVSNSLADTATSRSLARKGQQHVLESFSLEALARRVDALYTALLAGERYEDPVGGFDQHTEDTHE